MCLIKVMSGSFKLPEMRNVISYNMSRKFDIFECGLVHPEMNTTNFLSQGQVGYFLSNMKTVKEANVGDTFYQEGVSKEEI